MPKFYNLGSKGLNKLLLELFIGIFEYTSVKQLIKVVSSMLLNLLNQLYPNTIKYQDELMKICNVLYKNNHAITLRTLDGSVLKYKYLEVSERFGQIYRGNKTLTYRVYLPGSVNTKLSPKHLTSFPPNYIHSLDGALCRVIFMTYYTLTGNVLEPLHDSFRIGFNESGLLLSVTKYVYLYYFFNFYFHRDKLGISLISNGTIELNSPNYLKYQTYFPKGLNLNSKHILESTFIDVCRDINDDLRLEVLSSFDRDLMLPQPTEELYLKFLNNNFMYYF